MHVTLRFFGASDEAQAEGLRKLVTSCDEGTSALVRATSVTGFPSGRRARILVLDLEDGGVLARVAARAETAAAVLGYVAETRPYRPHLTLARIKVPADVTAYAGEAARLPAGRVTAITLYDSTTSSAGPVYTALARVGAPL